MTNQDYGQYPPSQHQWDNAGQPDVSKPSLWQRFKRWPLMAKIGTLGCGGLVAVFALLLVAGLIITAVDPDGMEEVQAEQEQERLDREAEEAETEAEEERLVEDEAEREAEEAAAEEAEREAEEEAERQAEDEAAAEREAEEERQREEEAAAEEEAERGAEEEAAAEREAEEEGEQESRPSAGDLGQQIEEAALSAAAVSSFTEMPSSPVVAVTEIEDMGASTIRIYVQQSLTDPARDDVARWFFNMTCMEVPEVDTIVVRDAFGIDSNHYAAELSNMPACQ